MEMKRNHLVWIRDHASRIARIVTIMLLPFGILIGIWKVVAAGYKALYEIILQSIREVAIQQLLDEFAKDDLEVADATEEPEPPGEYD